MWTADEQNQVRQGLGVDGGKSATVSGDITAILVDTGTTIPALLPSSLSSGRMRSDILAINAIVAAAANLSASAATMVLGTIDTTGFTPTTTEFEVDDITEATTDHYNNRLIFFRTGALAGQMTEISAYALTGGRGHFTVVAMTEAPADDDTIVMV